MVYSGPVGFKHLIHMLRIAWYVILYHEYHVVYFIAHNFIRMRCVSAIIPGINTSQHIGIQHDRASSTLCFRISCNQPTVATLGCVLSRARRAIT